MISRFFILLVFLLLGCADLERNNPYDQDAVNYIGKNGGSSSIRSSSSGVASSSSQREIVFGEPVYYGDETYETVVIGTQTWLKRNLNVILSSGEGNSVCYNNLKSNCDVYGRLYDWASAMNLPSSCNSSDCADQVQEAHRGICPEGWHIPSEDDWTTLAKSVQVYGITGATAGTQLKAASGWQYYSGVPVSPDAYGFSALPGGNSITSGSSFSSINNYGFWWIAGEYSSNNAYCQRMDYNSEGVGKIFHPKSYLQSVRCVKD